MTIVDLNLLIYALDARSVRHRAARDWLQALLSGTEVVALPWVVLLGFLRLSTKAAAFVDPLTPEEALTVVDGWLGQPSVSVVHPGRRHPALLRELLEGVGTAGNLVTDAHLAALAIENGAELLSCDSDFARFPGLRWRDPLR